MSVTKEQFAAYRRVQEGGQFNMILPQAREATGLSEETYREILLNYSVYFDKYEKEQEVDKSESS